jgi:hypothetical protein
MLIKFDSEEDLAEKMSKISPSSRRPILCTPRMLTVDEWNAKYGSSEPPKK